MTKELRATEVLQMDFLSDVSHEFQTPINAIEGYTMLLQGEELSPDQEKYVEKIHLQHLCCTKFFCHNIKTLIRFSNFCQKAVRFQMLFKISLRNFLHCFTKSGNWFQ